MMGAGASRCAWVAFGSKETVTHVAFFSVPHLSPRSPVNQYFVFARSTFPECPSTDRHGHMELAKSMFGMLMPVTVAEITLAKQMTAAGLHVVGFHPPHEGSPDAAASETASARNNTTNGNAFMFSSFPNRQFAHNCWIAFHLTRHSCLDYWPANAWQETLGCQFTNAPLGFSFPARPRPPWIGVDPRFNALRDDPRFQDLVRRIGIPRA